MIEWPNLENYINKGEFKEYIRTLEDVISI